MPDIYWKTSIPCKMVSNSKEKYVCSICKKEAPYYVIRIGFENEFDICHVCAEDIDKATYCTTFYGEEKVYPEDGNPVPARFDI